MTKELIAFYQKLMKTGFEYAGMMDNASIILENFGEVSPVCGSPDDYMRLNIRLEGNDVQDARYECITDPTTNVALEILCALMKGKSLNDVADLKEDAFCQYVGSEDEGLREKAKELLKLLNGEILEYRSGRQTG